MRFDSYSYLVFFPVVTLLYFAIPHRFRPAWLCVASYFFYMCWNAAYALLLLASTLITYAGGLLIARAGAHKKLLVFFIFFINLGILFFFKYFYFALGSANAVLAALGIPAFRASFDVLLPVGISFYTFQALGYTVDVYRGEDAPERNLVKYMLFISFFPQLVAGPIERAKNLLAQIGERHTFDYDRAKLGLLRMAWGLFLKLMMADRLALIIHPVFDAHLEYTGFQLLLALLLFAFQIYCDFAGYTEIAIGSAQVMGFRLMENFRQPYFAVSIRDFWGRWHISLSTWFRDYLYFPLTGKRYSRMRRYRNLMITFLVSGLWHGASWNFVFWGALHGAYQLVGELAQPLRRKMLSVLKLRQDGSLLRWGKVFVTFALVNFAWIFFRAGDLGAALSIAGRIAGQALPTFGLQGLFALLSKTDLAMVGFGLALLLLKDWAAERGHNPLGWIGSRRAVLRWPMYVLFTLLLIAFGIYGAEYAQTDFIYFQF